jgi:hypothetical protein
MAINSRAALRSASSLAGAETTSTVVPSLEARLIVPSAMRRAFSQAERLPPDCRLGSGVVTLGQ